eukprot:13167193-Alexandrium_andersonii.AAC.1
MITMLFIIERGRSQNKSWPTAFQHYGCKSWRASNQQVSTDITEGMDTKMLVEKMGALASAIAKKLTGQSSQGLAQAMVNMVETMKCQI